MGFTDFISKLTLDSSAGFNSNAAAFHIDAVLVLGDHFNTIIIYSSIAVFTDASSNSRLHRRKTFVSHFRLGLYLYCYL